MAYNLFRSADKSCDEHKLVLGTLTEDSVPNYLLIASVKLPYDLTQPDTSKEEDGSCLIFI